MDDNHAELYERLIAAIGAAILGEGTESVAVVLSRCADLIEQQAARIQQQALEYASLQAQCDEHLARIAELAKERDALKADAERWRFSGTMFFRMMSPDMGGNHDWVANGRGVGRGNTLNAAIDARIAALQAEKETR